MIDLTELEELDESEFYLVVKGSQAIYIKRMNTLMLAFSLIYSMIMFYYSVDSLLKYGLQYEVITIVEGIRSISIVNSYQNIVLTVFFILLTIGLGANLYIYRRLFAE